MPGIPFNVPCSDMRWRNTNTDPPEAGTDVLGLFLFWDSTNHVMHEVVHQCNLCEEEGWSIIIGYEDGPDGVNCNAAKTCPPAFWADLTFKDRSMSPHPYDASLN